MSKKIEQVELPQEQECLVREYAELQVKLSEAKKVVTEAKVKLDNFEPYKMHPNTISIKSFVKSKVDDLTNYQRIIRDEKFKTKADLMQGQLQAYSEVLLRFDGKILKDEYYKAKDVLDETEKRVARFCKEFVIFLADIKKKYYEMTGEIKE